MQCMMATMSFLFCPKATALFGSGNHGYPWLQDARMQLNLWLLFTVHVRKMGTQTKQWLVPAAPALRSYMTLKVPYHISYQSKCQGHLHATHLLPCDTCCHVCHCYCDSAAQTVLTLGVFDTSRVVMVPQQHFVAHLQRWNHSCDCNIKTYCAAWC